MLAGHMRTTLKEQRLGPRLVVTQSSALGAAVHLRPFLSVTAGASTTAHTALKRLRWTEALPADTSSGVAAFTNVVFLQVETTVGCSWWVHGRAGSSMQQKGHAAGAPDSAVRRRRRPATLLLPPVQLLQYSTSTGTQL